MEPRSSRAIWAAGDDGAIFVWDFEGHELRRFTGHHPVAGRGVLSIAVSEDGRRLASAGADTVRYWDAASGRQLWSGDERAFEHVAVSPDGTWVLAVSSDVDPRIPTGLSILDGTSGREVHTVPTKTRLRCAVFSPDGRHVLTGGDHGAMRLLDFQALELYESDKRR
jgi:WD40 repeat protein